MVLVISSIGNERKNRKSNIRSSETRIVQVETMFLLILLESKFIICAAVLKAFSQKQLTIINNSKIEESNLL